MKTAPGVRFVAVAGLIVLAVATDLGAQTEPLPAQMITVEGRAMRISTAGMERRKPGQSVVILEMGATGPGDALDTWRPVFLEIARLAPVFAYERRGIGRSEPDTVRPTLRRVGQSLHALLQETRIAPPYVLVGQSWGGVFIRSFSDQYPKEVVGLVYLDVTDFEATGEKKLTALGPENRKIALEPPVIPEIPPDTPSGLRAEYEQIKENMLTDFAEARSFRQPAGVPVSVVISARKGGSVVTDALLRLQISNQAEWAFTSSNGLLIVSDAVGHIVHRDDPVLVVQAVRHVLEYPPADSAK